MQKDYYTLTEKLSAVAKTAASKIALQIKKPTGYEQYTYQDLYNNAQKVAQALIGSGIQKAERVAIILENRPEWAFIYFGILFSGATAVPLDPQSTKDDLEYFFKNSESKIVFTSPSLVTKIYAATQTNSNLPKIILLDKDITEQFCDFSNFLAGHTQSPTNIEIKPDDIASILYTSGTTGKPKGVMLTHKNFSANFCSIEKLAIFGADHNVLSILPLHHSFPFMVTLIIPLFSQSKITYIAKIKREEIAQCMRETAVTVLVGVPQFFHLFSHTIQSEINGFPLFIRLPLLGCINLGNKLRQLTGINLNKLWLAKIHAAFGKHLKYFVSGGAKLDKNIETFFNKIGFTLIQGYGLTETAPIVTLNPVTKIKIGSVGKTIPDVDIKIIDPNPNGIGEIAIRGPNVMPGYYQRDQETQEVLKNNWFYSGDLGYCDNQGYLFLTGRKKEIIILDSGKNISPEEVESHYAKSHHIKELCVLATGTDEKEKLTAVIVPNFDHFKKTGEMNIHETIKLELEILSQNYPLYKSIMGFIITKDDLPRTNLGKLKRYEIHNKYSAELMGAKPKISQEEKLGAEDLAILDSPIYKIMVAIITKEKELQKPVLLNDHLSIDLDFDSLSRIELIAALEKQFNTSLPESSIAKISTIKELVLAIEQSLAAPKSKSSEITTTPPQNLWQDILHTDPAKIITDKIDIAPGWLAKIITMFFYIFIYIVTKLMWRIKITGTENLPPNTAFILCPNHASYLDAFLILAAVPTWLKLQIFFLSFKVYFDVPIVRNIIKIGRVIPLDLATNLLDAMRACSYVLRHRRIMCIFPEGGRSPDGSIQPFKKGVGILARELNIPLVPVYIDGAFKALPIGKACPHLSQIKITFGKPMSPGELKAKGFSLGTKDEYEAIAKGLETEATFFQAKVASEKS